MSLVKFCADTIIPQHMTLFALDQLCDSPGVCVSKRVRLRYDKSVVIFCEAQLHHEA